jgi:hypothetical protein
MRVTKVNVAVRFSKEMRDGAWKSIELGAEATLDEGESREEATNALYTDLTADLRQLWKGNGKPATTEQPQVAPSDNGQRRPYPV